VAVNYLLNFGKLRNPLVRYRPPIVFIRVKLVEILCYSVGTTLLTL